MSSIEKYNGSIVVDGVSYRTHKISSIRSLSENTKVYNLEVANDNSYTVNHYAVHNCDDPS
jgi:intein/homing endonuclease